MRITHKRIGMIGMVLAVLAGCACVQPKSTDSPPKLRNQVSDPHSGDVLAESPRWTRAGVWIYLQKKGSAPWTRLIPGRCPQWFPDGMRFYYFLDVGYDGSRAELWSADRHGEARLRESTCDYWIDRSPVVSEDGKKLAWHYSTCGAAGFFEDIKVIDLASGHWPPESKVVLRCPPGTKIESIEWSGDGALRVMAHGRAKKVDTTGEGKKPIP